MELKTQVPMINTIVTHVGSLFLGTKILITSKIFVPMIALSAGISLVSITWVETWIWSPVFSLFLLLGAMLLDTITAVKRNLHLGLGVETKKLPNFLINFIIIVGFLSMFHNLSRLNEVYLSDVEGLNMGLDFLAVVVYMVIFFSQMLSAVKNAAVAGILPKALEKILAGILSKYVDIYKNPNDDSEDLGIQRKPKPKKREDLKEGNEKFYNDNIQDENS